MRLESVFDHYEVDNFVVEDCIVTIRFDCVDLRTCFSNHLTPVVDYFNLIGDASSTTHCQLSYDKNVLCCLQKLCCRRFSETNDTSFVSDCHLGRL